MNASVRPSIKPQPGKQYDFLNSKADMVIYGGAAGGGKTYALLMEAVRFIHRPGFGAVIFRKTATQITKEGGLWDTAETIYPAQGGRGVRGNLVYHWDVPKTKITFAHLTRDDELENWQGTAIPLICFDELTHFSKKQFFYMPSRNRMTIDCTMKPYIRATTNPDPNSWVRKFIDWWIGEDGYAIPERSGVIRYFVHQNDQVFWFDTSKAAKIDFPDTEAKSFTFINSNIYDNKILIKQDPHYISNLQALPQVERERLLGGNWDVTAGAGDYFQKEQFEVVPLAPPLVKQVRCWDFAATPPSATNPDPDWTVGLKAGLGRNGTVYITDIVRARKNPADVRQLFLNTTSQDGVQVYSVIPEDPGSAGKSLAADYIKAAIGYSCKAVRVTGDKEARATPASSQAAVNNIKLLRGTWNDDLLTELENFPLGKHDDQVDCLSDAIRELVGKIVWDYSKLL